MSWLWKKQISVVLIFYLLVFAYFGRGDLLVCHSELCRLVSGSYSKIQVSSPVLTCLKKFCHFRCVQEGQGTHSFGFPSGHWWEFLGPAWYKFSAYKFEGQNFVDGLVIQIQHTTDHSDCQTLIRPHEIPPFGHIFFRFDVQGLPERGSSSTISRPTKTDLCHLKICVHERPFSP